VATMRTPIAITPWMRPLLLLTGATASTSFVDLAEGTVTVQLGAAFRATFPVSAATSASRWEGRAPLSIGAHGWRGKWLVNGARRPLVVIDLDPVQRARVLGVPVKLSQLVVSVEDPDALVDELV
jgi:hypothetical protein